MPQRMWRHTCPGCGVECLMSTPRCSSCGGLGGYDGWHLRMHEAMAAYQTAYGLKPMGSHRRMADALFDEVKVRCHACGGRGIRTAADGAGWEVCAVCRGLRILFTCPAEEIAAIRRRALEAFADAAADPVPGFVGAPLALDLARGQIINLEIAARRAPQR